MEVTNDRFEVGPLAARTEASAWLVAIWRGALERVDAQVHPGSLESLLDGTGE